MRPSARAIVLRFMQQRVAGRLEIPTTVHADFALSVPAC
jgi:hypothetical protein